MSDRFENFSWRPTNAPHVGRTDDIFFLDENIGWAVNSTGQILKTTDGFRTYTVQKKLDHYLRCCGFANETTGWIGTFDRNERLFRTTDGVSWQRVENLPDGAPEKVCGLCVVNENVVYVSGTNRPWEKAAILKTVDGGASWQRIDMEPFAASLIDIYFTDEKNGWVVGGVDTVKHPNRPPLREDVIPTVLHTTDGGATWTNIVENLARNRIFPQGEWGWKIQRISDSHMLVVLQNERDGAILRSDDGGITWQRLRINDRQRNSNLEGIGFLNQHRGWVGGWGDLSAQGGYTSVSSDGGQNWHEANEVGFRLNRFRFVGDPIKVGYASGDTVYKFTDEPTSEAAMFINRAETAESILSDGDSVSMDVRMVPETAPLTIQIWDRWGELVRLFEFDSSQMINDQALNWDFRNESGDLVPDGPYIVRIRAGDFATSRLVYRKTN